MVQQTENQVFLKGIFAIVAVVIFACVVFEIAWGG